MAEPVQEPQQINLRTIKAKMDSIARNAGNLSNLESLPQRITDLQMVTRNLSEGLRSIYQSLDAMKIPESGALLRQVAALNEQIGLLRSLVGTTPEAGAGAGAGAGFTGKRKQAGGFSSIHPAVGGYKWSRRSASKSKSRKGKKTKKSKKTKKIKTSKRR
tara:strand:+ start:1531 stop:2010 length:480 start_codon:yes stop_codon:yes gene_type:complete